MFTWVPFYRELAQRVLEFRNKQGELIAMLQQISDAPHNLPMISLRDEDLNGNKLPLGEIDPFTFFASFNRGVTDANRIAILQVLKEKLHLQAPVPEDFIGIPVVNNMAAWFFPYLSNGRDSNDIPKLWELAQAASQGGPEQLDSQLWTRCLDIYLIGMAKLTMGMFWFNPHKYLSLDKQIRSYLKSRGVQLQGDDLDSYRQFIAQTHDKLGTDHPKISRDAWESSQGKTEMQENQIPAITPQTRFWKLSPGERGYLWDTWREKNYCAIGWRALGDVRAMTQVQLEARRVEIVTHPERFEKADHYTPTRVKQVWRFAHEIKPGDRIVANRGISKVLGIGVVTGPCEFHADVDNYLHHLPVRWYDVAVRDVVRRNWLKTLNQLTRTQFETIENLKGKIVTPPPPPPPLQSKPPSFPLNQIFYGPPGTGKTYRTIERAVEIVDSVLPGDHAASKKRFDELMQQGRIGFITFHQSYSYEDFVEGIRPIFDAARDGEARYDCRDGVLKEMALQALGACLEPARPGEATFEDVWNALLDKIEDEPAWECPGLSAGSSFKINVTPAGNLQASNTISGTGTVYSCPRKHAETVWNALRDGSKANSTRVHQLVGNSHTNFIAAVVEELKRLKPSKTFDLASEKIAPDAVLGFLRGNDDYRLKEKPHPRYVLIIDEINRGNISKILGELITLLEDDKRLGADNALTVTLPYSGDRFALPSNLYILGTMNTADKSLALVDVALRRRFEFRELAPDWNFCPALTAPMRDVLHELNARITLRLDREHRIGHAYFMGVNNPQSFDQVFRLRVLPLLHEYFYNDWEGLRFVLGEGKDKQGFVVAIPNSQVVEARNKWQWFFDAPDGGAGFDCLATLQANYNIGATANGATANGELDNGVIDE